MKTNQLIPSIEHIQNSDTWIGGPCHNIQKQHIPGYQGHIHGLLAESQHGKSFAKVTAECMEQRLTRGIDLNKDERYNTNYITEFNAPNMRKPELQSAGERIMEQAQIQEKIINIQRQQAYDNAPKSIQDVPPIDRQPIVGYQGHRAVYRYPLKKIEPPQPPQQYIHPLNTLKFEDAKTMLQTNKDFRQNVELIRIIIFKFNISNKKFEQKQAPVVGYTGFMKGIRAENMYGQTFKDISTQVINNK